MKTLLWTPNHPNTGGWKDRHEEAVRRKDRVPGGHVASSIEDWTWYAVGHEKRFGSPISEDYFLGPAWLAWGKALRALLNGEMGNFDCGTLDSILVDNMIEAGFKEEDF